jgi:hypothetical protein
MSSQNLLPMLILLLLFVPLETKTAPQSDQTKATNESATASCPGQGLTWFKVSVADVRVEHEVKHGFYKVAGQADRHAPPAAEN